MPSPLGIHHYTLQVFSYPGRPHTNLTDLVQFPPPSLLPVLISPTAEITGRPKDKNTGGIGILSFARQTRTLLSKPNACPFSNLELWLSS